MLVHLDRCAVKDQGDKKIMKIQVNEGLQRGWLRKIS